MRVFVMIVVLCMAATVVMGMTGKERILLRDTVRDMFYHGYNNYMEHAFPLDELKPLSCTGRGPEGRGSLDDTLGGFSLTLVDTLDTLVVLGDFEEFNRAIKLVINTVTFNRDVTVSVFEVTIRVLGGLLSAHLMAEKYESKMPDKYNGELLDMAHDLGVRLLPAFETPTGIPYSRVNLLRGVLHRETPETCTAGAGTLLLEFGMLSSLTGDPTFMHAARRALLALWERRSPLALVGNVINVQTGKWIRHDSGTGAGIDSFFEYLFKGYILFGDEELHDIFQKAYSAVRQYQKKGQWYFSVHMLSGNIVRDWVENLQLFWPGLQVMLGDIDEAAENLNAFHQLWKQYGFPPEAYSVGSRVPVPNVSGYPLRPEMAESTLLLYQSTRDMHWLRVGRDIVYSLYNYTRVPCGFAAVADVTTKEPTRSSFSNPSGLWSELRYPHFIHIPFSETRR